MSLNDLYIKLKKVGINAQPKIPQLVKLVQSQQGRIARGKVLAASNNITAEKTALMLWAKDNKAIIDAEKRSIGSRAVSTTRTIHGAPVTTTRYVVPSESKEDYSNWLIQTANSSGILGNYLAKAQQQRAVSARLKK